MDNGAIMGAASRWPLMIDPQLQGVKWIMAKEAPNGLRIIQQSQPKYIDQARAPACHPGDLRAPTCVSLY